MSRLKRKLVIATHNAGKVREFQQALADLPLKLLSASELNIGAFPEETGTSYEENAHIKAGFVALKTGLPSLADDSGLEVDALGGEPGIYSARFGGNLTDGERLAYLLEKMLKVPDEKRSARFVCALVLALPGGAVHAFKGHCHGTILRGPQGESGFGYDPVFYSHALKKTFAESSRDEKAQVSHRGKAVSAFRRWFSETILQPSTPSPGR